MIIRLYTNIYIRYDEDCMRRNVPCYPGISPSVHNVPSPSDPSASRWSRAFAYLERPTSHDACARCAVWRRIACLRPDTPRPHSLRIVHTHAIPSPVHCVTWFTCIKRPSLTVSACLCMSSAETESVGSLLPHQKR